MISDISGIPEDLSDETLSSEEEAVVPEENITTGRQLLATVKNRIKEEKPFNSKRADEHRAPFRFSPKIGTINENKVFRVSTDDRRYGVFRSGSEEEISDSGSDWSEGPDTYIQCNCCSGIKYLCCCHCLRRSAGKVPPVIKWVKDVNTGGNTDCDTGGNTGGNTDCDTGGNTDGENVNVEEKKPKRVGKMKRLRNFLRRLCCCVGKSNED
ncbi:uncharacterized protein LOC134281026 [Saccostrea cucullata]|uniref:uncharacterized protein LOC134281026 n=1 Tax=Saccostrea cuccullata TaxID=36930 RepID=UPI002ED12565